LQLALKFLEDALLEAMPAYSSWDEHIRLGSWWICRPRFLAKCCKRWQNQRSFVTVFVL